MSLPPQPLPNYSARPHSRAVDFVLYRRETLDLSAPYQRESLWGTLRRQNLIRSLLMGLPIGSIIINRRSHEYKQYMAIIDGKQRIETLQAMADGELGIPAVWVPERFRGKTIPINYDGHTVDGVVVDGDDHPFMSVLMNFPLATIEAEVETVEEEAEIFRLINTGGVPQTEETIAAAATIEGGPKFAPEQPAIDVGSLDLPEVFAAIADGFIDEVPSAAFVNHLVHHFGHTIESARDGIYTLQDAGRLTITDRYALLIPRGDAHRGYRVNGVCRECGQLFPSAKPRQTHACDRCGSPATNPFDRYTTGPHVQHVKAFLRELPTLRNGESFGDLAVKHMLPRDIVSDMTMTKLGYIAWREAQGFVLTDAGRELAGL